MSSQTYDDYARFQAQQQQTPQQQQQQQQQHPLQEPQEQENQREVPHEKHPSQLQQLFYGQPASQYNEQYSTVALTDSPRYFPDNQLQDFFSNTFGDDQRTSAEKEARIDLFPAQKPSSTFELHPQTSNDGVNMPQISQQQDAFMPQSYLQPQAPTTSTSHMPTTSAIAQPHQLHILPQPNTQANHSQYYDESMNLPFGYNSPYGFSQPPSQARPSYYPSYQSQLHSESPYIDHQSYGIYNQPLIPSYNHQSGDIPGRSFGSVNNDAAVDSTAPVLPSMLLNQSTPHWPIPSMHVPAEPSNGQPVAQPKAEKKKRAAAGSASDQQPAKKKATKTEATKMAPANSVSSFQGSAIDPAFIQQQAVPVPQTQVQPKPPVIEKPKEIPLLEEKDPVTALRIRVATAFKTLADDKRILTDRLVEIMLSIPEEAYGTTTKFDLRDVYWGQLTSSTGTNREIWRAFSENMLGLARIRNWLVFDYKAKRYDSAAPVLKALEKIPVSLEQLKRVKMEKLLLLFESKGSDKCREIAAKILAKSKTFGDKEGSPAPSPKPESEMAALDSNKKPQMFPQSNSLSGFTIRKKAAAPKAAPASAVPKEERPTGNTSFFQSLQKKPAASTTSKPTANSAAPKKSKASAAPTPVEVVPQPRISSLFSSMRTAKTEDGSDGKSTPEPAKPKKKLKTVSWKPEADLVQVKVFVSEPNERSLNVNSAVHEQYRNARELDISEGRAAFKKAAEAADKPDLDIEEDEIVPWSKPIEIDFASCERYTSREHTRNIFRRGGAKEPNSSEAAKQKERELNVLMAVYYRDEDIPPSAVEPDDDLPADESEMKEIPVPHATKLAWMLLLLSQNTAPAVPTQIPAAFRTQQSMPMLQHPSLTPAMVPDPSRVVHQPTDFSVLAAMIQGVAGASSGFK